MPGARLLEIARSVWLRMNSASCLEKLKMKFLSLRCSCAKVRDITKTAGASWLTGVGVGGMSLTAALRLEADRGDAGDRSRAGQLVHERQLGGV
jgi:hypothetical protein